MHRALAVSVAAIVFSALPAIVSAQSINNGLVAQFPFDENTGTQTVDSVGGIVGKFVGNPTWAAGKMGSAINFNGTSGYVAVSSAALQNLQNITVSAWVYAKGVGSNSAGIGRIVSKGTYGGASAAVRFALQVTADGTLQFNAGYQGGGAGWGTPSGTLKFNGWHQVTVTYAFGTKQLPVIYVDGVKQLVAITNAVNGTTPVNDDAAFFIGDRGDNTRVWNGLIDQVRVYNRVLSASDVATLYQTDTPPNIVVIMTD
ncbi:MAG TPA: LamG domain-containing protein, partial [Candidatus Paceibacterota bacterium]|nr:LamG domain-containing protein [Candidatus Paceibacterota bacterium]